MALTVISHFFNEETLLPFWLDHHLRVFDHGILIDYSSTDSSVDIIRRLAPTWDVVPSRNREFDALECDREVMDIEGALDGWKIALNTTEFLLHHDLRGYLYDSAKWRPDELGVWTSSVVMVDTASTRNTALDHSRDLVLQRHDGIPVPPGSTDPRSGRLLHRAPDGRYLVGRHESRHRQLRIDPELVLLWFGWSPFDQTKQRKLQIQQRLSARDRAMGLGWQHIVTDSELEERFAGLSRRAISLFEDARYERALRLWRTRWSDPAPTAGEATGALYAGARTPRGRASP